MENSPENIETNQTEQIENKDNNSESQEKQPSPRPKKKKRKDIINNSGQGDVPVVKVVTDKFNWGAFFFSWIWGICYKKWIMLLVIVAYMIPFVGALIGLGLQIWFGINGNKWAWQSKRYRSIQEFHEIHKKWATAGVILMIINLITVIAMFAFFFQQGASQMMNMQTQGFTINGQPYDSSYYGSSSTNNYKKKIKTNYSSGQKPQTKTYSPNQTMTVDLTKPYTGK